ncbi:hypothetical protein WHR41_01959 [Cladosporium halotolerans]|uniref:Uncharacterized protein n=1 Tax=Cladosporium halotolerans TaxID=1052096 RepID=A0AB34KWA3_9PEZI
MCRRLRTDITRIRTCPIFPHKQATTIMADTAESYEKALEHLEHLQTQLDALRSTLPNLVSPLIKPQTSKAQLFADIKKSATTSTNQLASFRNDWNSEQTQQLLSKSRESEQKDPDMSKGQEVAAFGWSEKEEKQSS